jgi:prepilin-type N-terminal cleavage/methylation domain-containing protein
MMGKPVSAQRGFTLIEALITVAIISILAMVSTPFYQAYTVQAKVGGDLLTLAPVKQLVNEQYIVDGTWPMTNEDAGAKDPIAYFGNYVNSVTIVDQPTTGSIELNYDDTVLRALAGKTTIVFYPVLSPNGQIATWNCDAGTMIDRYRPKQCRSEG